MTDHRFDAATKAEISTAASWFVRLRGAKGKEARAGFARWRLRDPARGRAYREIETVWSLAGEAAEDPEISALIDEATSHVTPRAGRAAATGVWMRRAACVAVLLGGVGIALLTMRGLVPGISSDPAVVYRTAVGERRDIVLADGSTVRLDAASQVEVQLAPRRRDVRLIEGRARFIVAKAPDRPFVVRSGAASVTALGTVFDVSRQTEAVEISLFEGRVEVVRRNQADKATGRLVLTPGQAVRVAGQGGLRAVPLMDDPASDWTEGRLVFAGSPLSEVVAELNRYSPRRISLDAPPGDRRRFRGEFSANDIDGAVQVLAVLYDFSIGTDPDGGIRLVKK